MPMALGVHLATRQVKPSPTGALSSGTPRHTWKTVGGRDLGKAVLDASKVEDAWGRNNFLRLVLSSVVS